MILIVDDDASVAASLSLLLKQHGYRSISASTPDEALGLIRRERPSLVIQDMNFTRRTTGEEGLQLLANIRSEEPALPVILMTAWASIALAVEGMKRGAADFITKPWSNANVVQSVETALGLAAMRADASGGKSRAELDEEFDFSNIIGSDPKIMRFLELIGRVAPTEASVLIMGESGTGKELIAEALHRNSRRRGAPFVKVNLGGISAHVPDGRASSRQSQVRCEPGETSSPDHSDSPCGGADRVCCSSRSHSRAERWRHHAASS